MITCKPDIKEVAKRKGEDEFILIGCDKFWAKFENHSQAIDIIRDKIGSKMDDSTVMKGLFRELAKEYELSGQGCEHMTSILIRSA